MKYFKFAQISADTGISWAIEQPITGPSWPQIPGLEASNAIQLAKNTTYYVAPVGNDARANSDNHIFELTFEEYTKEVEDHVTYLLNKEKDMIYFYENEFRKSIFSKYHDTATVAGIYKYEQAKALLLDEDADAPDVRVEAASRGVDVIDLANRIVENHKSFRTKEAKIAGIRGKILDRLNSYEFDLTDPQGSYEEFMAEEVVGTEIRPPSSVLGVGGVEVDVKVRKYHLALETRFKYE